MNDYEFEKMSALVKCLFFNDRKLICFSGAKSATPDQGSDANICPRGSYCLEGTDQPEPCPAGTFSNDLGKSDQLFTSLLRLLFTTTSFNAVKTHL